MMLLMMLLIIMLMIAIIVIAMLYPSRESELKHLVVIERNSIFKNKFYVWSDIRCNQIADIPGVISAICFEGAISVYVDPRVGRETVIEQILNIVESDSSIIK